MAVPPLNVGVQFIEPDGLDKSNPYKFLSLFLTGSGICFLAPIIS